MTCVIATTTQHWLPATSASCRRQAATNQTARQSRGAHRQRRFTTLRRAQFVPMDVDKNLLLVKSIEKFPCLYNYNLIDYARKDVTDKAWNEVSNETKLTGESLDFMYILQ